MAPGRGAAMGAAAAAAAARAQLPLPAACLLAALMLLLAAGLAAAPASSAQAPRSGSDQSWPAYSSEEPDHEIADDIHDDIQGEEVRSGKVTGTAQLE